MAFLTYTEPPEVTVDETTKLVKAGESVVLSCKITGTPLPSISWLKDGQHIPFSDSSRFKVSFRKKTNLIKMFSLNYFKFNLVFINYYILDNLSLVFYSGKYLQYSNFAHHVFKE